MDWICTHVFLVFAALIGISRSQECFIETGQTAFANRTNQYSKVLFDQKNEENFKVLCLTQIHKDSAALEFENALKLCNTPEAENLQASWVLLNQNITRLCQQECPQLLTLPSCKNMTFLKEIEFGKYEKFCETFQQSYTCAQTALSDCRFGISLYGQFVEPSVLSYRTHICNSGCSNIDETVAVISNCLEPLRKVDKAQICMAHYTFKECMRGSNVVCPEMMKLVKFVYRTFDRVDRHCTTTTTVTTTPLPETTEPITETVQPLTEIYELSESSTVAQSSTTDFSTTMTTLSKGLTEDMVSVKIKDCLTDEDLEVMGAAEVDVNSVLVYLKFEACLHNTTDDAETLSQILASLTGDIKSFQSRMRSEAWRIARQTLQEKSNCKGNKEEQTNGCSGHGYGLIPCNSVGVTACSLILAALFPTLSMFLLHVM